MQTITCDLFDLPLEDIDYRLSALTPLQRDIVALLARGQTQAEAAGNLCLSVSTLRARLYSAADRAGLSQMQLMGAYAIWSHAKRAERS